MAERQGVESIRAAETADEMPETVDEDEGLGELPGTVDEDENPGGRLEKPKGSSAARPRTRPDRPAGKKAYYRKVIKDLVPWLAVLLILLAVTQGIAGAVRIRQEARRAELSGLYGVEYEWK